MQIPGEVLYGVNELVFALVLIGLLLMMIEIGYRQHLTLPEYKPGN
jgi:hypothetical protein